MIRRCCLEIFAVIRPPSHCDCYAACVLAALDVCDRVADKSNILCFKIEFISDFLESDRIRLPCACFILSHDDVKKRSVDIEGNERRLELRSAVTCVQAQFLALFQLSQARES